MGILNNKLTMIYNCVQCDKKFQRSNTLEEHVDNVHIGLVLNCEYCNQTFKNNKGLNKHVYTFHKTRTYECKYCETKLPSQDSLKTHLKTSHVDPRIKGCTQCTFSCRSKPEFEKHMKEVHSEYVCKICNSKFNSAFILKSHNNVAHLLKAPNTLYPCKKCNYETQSKANFRKHLQIHEGFVEDEHSEPVKDVNDKKEEVGKKNDDIVTGNNEIEIVGEENKTNKDNLTNPPKQVFNVFSKEFALLRENNLYKVLEKKVPVVDLEEDGPTTDKKLESGTSKRIFNVFSEEFKALRKANMNLQPVKRKVPQKENEAKKRKEESIKESSSDEITEEVIINNEDTSSKEDIEETNENREIVTDTEKFPIEEIIEEKDKESIAVPIVSGENQKQNLMDDKDEINRKRKNEKSSKYFERKRRTTSSADNIGSSVLQYYYEREQHFPCNLCPYESTKKTTLLSHVLNMKEKMSLMMTVQKKN